MNKSLRALSAVATLALAHCGDSTTDPPTTTTDSGTCTSLSAGAGAAVETIRDTCDRSSFSFTAGGTLSDGIYTLSRDQRYVGNLGSGPGGRWYDTLRLIGVGTSDARYERMVRLADDREDAFPERGTATVDASAHTLTLIPSCGTYAQREVLRYDATSSGELRLTNSPRTFCYVNTYTRQ